MFLEDEDWDDEHAEQPLSKTVTNSNQQATGVTNVKVRAHPVANDVAESPGLAFRERERKREKINYSKTMLKQ